MKFQLCYTQSDYFGQMKSNTAACNTIRRTDTAEFFSDGSALMITGLVLFTFWWHPRAVSPGNVSVVSCALGRRRANVLPGTGNFPIPVSAATIGEAKAQGREPSQGWGRAGGLCACGTLMPRVALSVYGPRHSLDPPAPLQDPGDYAGLFSYAGSGSNYSVFKWCLSSGTQIWIMGWKHAGCIFSAAF